LRTRFSLPASPTEAASILTWLGDVLLEVAADGALDGDRRLHRHHLQGVLAAGDVALPLRPAAGVALAFRPGGVHLSATAV
jgi:hypothetical protein